MELLVFGHAGARTVVFPARFGRFYDYENWGLIEALRWPIEQGFLQLYCLDSIDAEALYGHHLHPRDRIRRHGWYEAYVLDEVLPLSRQLNPSPFTIAHGCSLGAYHAINIALRHPHRFDKVVALSGRFDLTQSIAHYRGLFDDYYDEEIYFHTPAHFVPNLSDHHLLERIRRLEIALAVGDSDPFVHSNRHLSHWLWEKGAWNALHLWPGEAHKPRDWRDMIRCYL
jgi:esterase/lipase superfamily enzyme